MARKGKVAVSITAENTGLKKGLRESEGLIGRSERRIGEHARTAAAALGVGFGVEKLVEFGKTAIETASSVNESLSKNRVLFGQYAKDVDAFTKTSADSFGISREAALEATGTFGNLFKAVNVAPKQAANLSVSLTKLAADMASFNNASPQEALEAIRSGLVGETEPLRRFGVNIQDATLRQQAMSMGLTHTTKNVLTPYQKALAAQALIVKQTAAAHGDFARTSSGLANQQRILKAEFSDLSGEAGKALLPALTKATHAATEFIKGIRSGTGAGGAFADKMREIADRVKPVVKFFADHPKLIAIAVGAWVAYRVAAAAAMAATRLKALGMFKGLVRPAAVAGAESGAAFGTAASTAASSRFGGGFGKGLRGLAGGMGGPGRLLGAALGTALIAEIVSKLHDPHGGLMGALKDIGNVILPLQPRGGRLPKNAPKAYAWSDGHLHSTPEPGTLPSPTSGPTRLPFSTRPSRRAPRRTPLGQNAPRAHTSSVQAHAASVHATPTRVAQRVTAHAASGGGTYSAAQLASLWVSAGGDPAAADTAAAVAMAESGGRSSAENHNTDGSIDRGLWQINSVHGVLSTFDVRGNAKAAVSISGNGRNWSPWVTYQTGAYRQFLGHSGGGTGGATVPVSTRTARRRPIVPHAALEHGQSGVSKGMGATFPKGVTGFQPGLTDAEIADLSADPETNQKARNMRLFAIGMRRNKIISDLRSGKVRNPATRQRLLDELRGLDSEMSGLLKPIDTSDTADTPDTSAADAAAAAEQERTDAIKANTDALQAVKDEIKKQNDFASQVTSVSLGQAWRAMADMISGQIAGVGYDGRAATAGDGSLARY